MTIEIDRRIYSDECISKAVYSLANKYVIKRVWLSSDKESFHVITQSDISEEAVIADIYSSLNDYKLRGIIEKETHDIRTILYAKAFSDCANISESDLD